MKLEHIEVRNANDKFETTCSRFVCIIDIMGFKDMVARMYHDSIYDIMKKINKVIKSKNDQIIKIITFSDSIIICSRDSYSFEGFAFAISSLSEDLFSLGIPHKGAFAFGTMTFDLENSIFFGQPLIDAHLLHEELNFYGIVAHGTAESLINGLKSSYTKELTTYYNCPFKNGSSSHLAIPPRPYKFNFSKELEFDKDFFISTMKNLRFKTSGYLRKYVDNTESYFNFLSEIEKKQNLVKQEKSN